MNLSQIDRDIQAAMRAQDTRRAAGLQAVRNAVVLATSQKRAALTEAEAQSVFRREIEERQTATVLTPADQNEIEVFASYLPDGMSDGSCRPTLLLAA